MKVIDHLERADRPLVSFEIIPPKRGGKLANMLGLIEELSQYKHLVIEVKTHA